MVLIGGGEMGRPGTSIETLPIDKEIIALSGKKHPKLLFIPTASGDARGYVEVVEGYFGKKLGCTVDTLLLYGKKINRSEIEKKIMSADIVYVGGGNTLRMLRMWKKRGVDVLLRKAAKRGKVLAGVSAGAVCWCRYGNSDARKMIDPSADYIRLKGLDLVPIFLVPHFDKEKARQSSVKKMLKGTKQFAIGLDNCSALVIEGNKYRVATSHPRASAHLCFWREGAYFDIPFKPKKLLPLQGLGSTTTIKP